MGKDSFIDYQKANLRRTVFIVIPLQMIELFTALLLVWKVPAGITPVQVWTNIALIGVTWMSTATLQVPNHQKLSRGFSSRIYSILVSSNWIRTLAWSIRGALVFWMLAALQAV